jgi:hypothetical protein
MEGWIMSDIRTSALGGVPFGTSFTRPANPQIGQTYYNGTLGVQEIYTSSGWLPATGANDFNVTLNGPVTTATFTKEYFAGAYTIASALLDSSYDIYVYDTAGNQVGYTKSPSLSATGNFNKIVIIGGSTGDLLSFSYKTTFTATATTGEITAGAFITSATPTALNTIDDTTVIAGGNFASNVAVYFVGSDNIERSAKSVVRSSSSSLIVTRPDNFPTNLGTYKIVVENPGITRPTGSSLHILNNAVTAGTTPNWTTAADLGIFYYGNVISNTLLATDSEGTDIDYTLISGTLPTGLSINQETGLLSGTVTASGGTYTFTIRAVDTGGNTVDRQFSVLVLSPIVSFESENYSANANTWVDSVSGVVLNKFGTTTKTGSYQISMASGNKWGFSTDGSSTQHISALDFGSSSFSIEAWIYIPTTQFSQSGMNFSNAGTQTNAGWRTFINNGRFWSDAEFNIYVRSEGTHLGFATTSTNGLEYALSSIGTGWKHFTFTRDGSGRKIYMNGALVASDSTVHTIAVNTLHDLNINGFTEPTSGSFNTEYGDQNVRFGHIRFYNSALGSSLVSASYNATKSRYGL